jgi:hypothetical protein
VIISTPTLKKHVSIVALLAAPFTLIACGGNSADPAQASAGQSPQLAASTTAIAAPSLASPQQSIITQTAAPAATATPAEAGTNATRLLASATAASGSSIDQVIADMSSPSEAMVIDPRYDWQYNPKVTMYAPRGDAIPSWWTGNRPTWTSAVLSWFTAFEAQGNKATNTRVQLKDLRFYVLSESTRKWTQVDMSAAPDLNLWKYPFDYAAPASGSGVRKESVGGISVKPKYPNFHHGWGNAKSINPQDVRAVFATIDFRLGIDDAAKADDRAAAKYVVDVGADYYPDMQLKWSLNYAPGVGNGRMLLATSDWRTATMLVPNKNYGSTMAEMKTNPPPLVAGSTATPAPAPTPTPVAIAGALAAGHSGKCLDVFGASAADGALIDQWSCTGGSNQQWTTRDLGQSRVALVSKASGKCLDIPAYSTADGVQLQQYTCNGGLNQAWVVATATDGSRKFTSVSSGKCLAVAASGTADGAKVVQASCVASAASQRWTVK